MALQNLVKIVAGAGLGMNASSCLITPDTHQPESKQLRDIVGLDLTNDFFFLIINTTAKANDTTFLS